MKLYDVSYNLKTQNILTEGWSTLTENQRTYLNTAERELWPLMEQLTKAFEAELTPAQIQSIFKGAEDNAMASGGHKSVLGKAGQVAKLPLDLMKKVDAKIGELGRMAQNAGPVKDMDRKFEELKKKIGASDGKIAQGIKFVSDWAKANPGKATLAVAILTAAAAFSGIGGGAAVGFLLRGTKDLLQGQKLSTAVGGAVKVAVYGAMAGWLFNQIGDWAAGIRAEQVPYETQGVVRLDFEIPPMEVTQSGSGISSITGQQASFSQTMGVTGGKGSMFFPDEKMFFSMPGAETGHHSMIEYAKELMTKAEGGDFGAWQKMQQFMTKDHFDSAHAMSANITKSMKDYALANDKALNIITNVSNGISAMAQGSVTAGAGGQPQIKPEDVKAGGKTGKDFDKGGKAKGESVDYETYLHQRLDELVPPKTNGATAPAPAPTGPAPTGGTTPAPAPAPTAPEKPSFLQRAKAGLGKLAGKAGAAIGRGAKELGNVVTVDKLTKAWKKAGEPTDTGSIVSILARAGLDNTEITSIGSTAKINLGTASAQDQAQDQELSKLASQLSAAGITKQQLMTADIHNEAELYESKLAVMLNQRLK